MACRNFEFKKIWERQLMVSSYGLEGFEIEVFGLESGSKGLELRRVELS